MEQLFDRHLTPKNANIRNMRLYIGYKYTHVEDKQSLIRDLLQLAGGFESNGHKTFILGRDIQNWRGSLPLWKTFPAILGNMLKSDAFVAFITSDVKSSGLSVEKTLAKLLGKKTIFACSAASHEPGNPQNIITFTDVGDAVTKTLAKLA